MVLGSMVTAAAVAAGCNEGEVPIGESGAAALVGAWRGYIENYQFPSGSDVITVTVQSGSGTEFGGVVTFGTGPMLSPPTAPDVGYPPGIGAAGPVQSTRRAFEGFEYTILDASLTDTRMRFGIANHELWKAWCELQTPFSQQPGSDSYGCLPNWGYMTGETCSQPDPATGMVVPRDCGQLYLCEVEMVCECTAQQCTVTVESPDVTFDLSVAGDRADGSVVGIGDIHNVRLTR